jgi:hypothetical protein
MIIKLMRKRREAIGLKKIQGDSNMTGADLCVNKPESVPVIFEPPCTY